MNIYQLLNSYNYKLVKKYFYFFATIINIIDLFLTHIFIYAEVNPLVKNNIAMFNIVKIGCILIFMMGYIYDT